MRAPLLFVAFISLLAIKTGLLIPRAASGLFGALYSQPALGASSGERFEDELLSLFESFKALLPDGVFDAFTEPQGGEGVINLISAILSPSGEYVSRALPSIALFISVAFIFSLGELFLSSSGEIAPTAKAALAAVLSLPVLSSLFDLADVCREGLVRGSDFFAGLIPIMTSVLAAAGGASSAAVSASGTSLSLAFVSEVLTKNLYPVFGLIFALSVIGSIDTGSGTGQLSKSIKGLFGFLIGAVSLIIGGTVALQSTVTAARDSLALRGARYAVSGMIPVVGGAVSGALSTLVSGIKLLSGTVGALSVASLAVLMGAPLVLLILYRAAISLSAAICSYLGASFGERFFTSLRSAVDSLIAIVASSLLLFALLLAVFVKTAGGVIGA